MIWPSVAMPLDALRAAGGDNPDSQPVQWIAVTRWRLNANGARCVHVHPVVAVNGQNPTDARVSDPSHTAIRYALDKLYKGIDGDPTCPDCGGLVAGELSVLGNAGPDVFAMATKAPWWCPACGIGHGLHGPQAPTGHARLALEARWAAATTATA